MADVVYQRQGFHQVDVQLKLGSDGARDLRNLHGVRQASAEVVGVAPGEDLCLVFQAAEGAGMDDAVAVPLKWGAIRMRRLGIAAPAGVFLADRV